MTSPRKSPYRPGGQYRPTWSFTSTRDTFEMGEMLTFLREEAGDDGGLTSYIFVDDAGRQKIFDVPADAPPTATVHRFRAVEARDGGCPECREQRYQGLGPPLEQVGSGPGPTLYYQCGRCHAIWEENLREAHILWNQLLTCEHLQPLERELRASGVRIERETRDWDDAWSGFWVYFRARIDPGATRAQFRLPDFVAYHEWDGRVAGNEAGFRCTRCVTGVMGVHAGAAEGHPVFPTDMKAFLREDRALVQQGTRQPSHGRSLLRDLMPSIAGVLVFLGAIALGWWAGKRQ